MFLFEELNFSGACGAEVLDQVILNLRNIFLDFLLPKSILLILNLLRGYCNWLKPLSLVLRLHRIF